jgi:hypothetical protein
MVKIPDETTLGELFSEAARALSRAGLNHRIDLYREVEIDDAAVRLMLGRSHRVRVRIKITATSLLFDSVEQLTTAEQVTPVPARAGAVPSEVEERLKA